MGCPHRALLGTALSESGQFSPMKELSEQGSVFHWAVHSPKPNPPLGDFATPWDVWWIKETHNWINEQLWGGEKDEKLKSFFLTGADRLKRSVGLKVTGLFKV